MATTTTNYGLTKPEQNDYVQIDVINDNMDKIDKAIGDKANKTDIPASLPANGGNADTVGGKHAYELSQKAYLVATSVDLFEYIESLTDEQLPPHSTVTIRAFNCKNSPIDKYPFTVEYSLSNGGDFIITVTRLEHKDWYILTAREVSTHKMYTCGKHNNVWNSWSLKDDVTWLPDGTDIEKNFLNNQPNDYHWTIRTFRILNSPSAPTNLGYDPHNNDFYYTVYRLGHDWTKLIARDVRSNRQFINSKLGGSWTGWQNIADGGNADTVDGWHVELRPQNFYGLRPIAMDTFDLQAGVTVMNPGQIYIMYE